MKALLIPIVIFLPPVALRALYILCDAARLGGAGFAYPAVSAVYRAMRPVRTACRKTRPNNQLVSNR